MACPIRSPWPRTPSATAVSTALSFDGSTFCSRSDRFSKTVLTSVLTFVDCNTAPAASRSGLGSAGYTRSTNFAPNAVVAWICACDVGRDELDLVGIDGQLQTRPARSLRRCCVTRPTSTPRSLTFAPVSITNPDRSDVSVTGT